MTRSRRTFTAQEKADAVGRYLVDKTPVSDLCDELGLQPTPIDTWQKQLFDNAAAFTRPGRKPKQENKKDKKIEAKIQLKNEVVAEILQEHVQLKKELGEP